MSKFFVLTLHFSISAKHLQTEDGMLKLKCAAEVRIILSYNVEMFSAAFWFDIFRNLVTVVTVTAAHGIMGRRFPDGGLLRYRK